MSILHLLALGWIIVVVSVSAETIKLLYRARRDARFQMEDDSSN